MVQRTTIIDFNLNNPIYSLATVEAYTVDANGDKTTTLATLYEGLTGSETLENPLRLDSLGKWVAPPYVEEPVVLTITGLQNTPDHDTGVVGATLASAVADAQTAANQALIFAEESREARDEAVKKLGLSLPDPAGSNDYIRGNGGSAYERRTVVQVRSDIQAIGGLGAGPDNAVMKTDGTTGGDVQRTGIVIDDSNRANGWSIQPGAGVAAATYTVSLGDAGRLQTVDFAGAVTITLPQVTTEDLVDGFVVSFYHKQATSIAFVVEGTDVLTHPFGATQSAGIGSKITCIKIEDGVWSLGGEVV